MSNPFRSEEAAFRFVWVTIGYFALIVIGSVINVWLGLAVFIVLTVGAVWFLVSRRARDEPRERQAPAAHGRGDYRILVIANETVGGSVLLGTIREHAAGKRVRVLVVTPALNSPLKHWVSDEDGARSAAESRLARSLATLRGEGLSVDGQIGDGDPIQAIEDALRTFAPDELIVSTHPPGRSNWLERGVVENARERFDVPVTHVIVDLEAEQS